MVSSEMHLEPHERRVCSQFGDLLRLQQILHIFTTAVETSGLAGAFGFLVQRIVVISRDEIGEGRRERPRTNGRIAKNF